MAQYTLNILRPSVNNLSARVFMRAAGLDFEEVDVWGKTMDDAYLDKYAPHLTPTLEDPDLPSGTLGESCAIMAYLSNKHGLDQFYPTDPGERARVDNANLYHTGTFYPYLARATYPTLGFPQYPGEVGPSEAGDDLKAQAVKDATAAASDALEAYERYFLRDRKFVGGDRRSIADIRMAASLEFLRSIDFPFSSRMEQYRSDVEEALGDAFSEPAADVRGFVDSVKSPA
jgi:glutathione S-transferase